MRNQVRPLFSVFCAVLATFLAVPVLGQGMSREPSPPPNAGDMGSPGVMAPMDNSGASAELRGRDREFVIDAARGGMAEVELGKLAVAKATNPDVKSFGQRMIDDHSRANDQLRHVAMNKGVTLPSGLDRKTRAEFERLDRLSGEQFDRAYADLMVRDHVKDVADFEREAKHSGGPDVRQFASTTLPTLQEHLSLAKDVQSRVVGAAAGPSQRR
jgi:putative membrane protein